MSLVVRKIAQPTPAAVLQDAYTASSNSLLRNATPILEAENSVSDDIESSRDSGVLHGPTAAHAPIPASEGRNKPTALNLVVAGGQEISPVASTPDALASVGDPVSEDRVDVNPSSMEAPGPILAGPSLTKLADNPSQPAKLSLVQANAPVDACNFSRNIKRRLDKGYPDLAHQPSRAPVSPDTCPDEIRLKDGIVTLWDSHEKKKVGLRLNRSELSKVRAELGELLHGYKQLLVAAGRNGKWTNFLRENKIPKPTADRYVEKFKASQLPKEENLLTEEVPEPTGEEVDALVQKVKSGVLRALKSREARSQFLAKLNVVFQLPEQTLQ